MNASVSHPVDPVPQHVDPVDQHVDVDLDPVLVAAREVIMEQGASRATLSEVARRAGVSRMTVYRRFSTWDRIVSALLTIELAQLLGEADLSAQTDAQVRERAVTSMMTLMRAIGGHDLLRRIAEVDPESLLPLLTRRFGQTQRAAAAYLAALLRSGMASQGGDGSVRDDDPQTMAMAAFLMCQSFTLSAPALESEPNGDQIVDQLRLALTAFLTPASPDPASPGPASPSSTSPGSRATTNSAISATHDSHRQEDQ